MIFLRPETINLTNTPGIYYSIAYFISTCLYVTMNKRRHSLYKTMGILAFFFEMVLKN